MMSTQRTVEDLAREAGFVIEGKRAECPHCDTNLLSELVSFAALIRADERSKALEEAASPTLPLPTVNLYPTGSAESRAYVAGIEHLRAAIRALKATGCPSKPDAADAARYRWLKERAVWRPGGLNAVTWDVDMPEPDMRAGALTETSVGDELDAAIDRALKATDRKG